MGRGDEVVLQMRGFIRGTVELTSDEAREGKREMRTRTWKWR